MKTANKQEKIKVHSCYNLPKNHWNCTPLVRCIFGVYIYILEIEKSWSKAKDTSKLMKIMKSKKLIDRSVYYISIWVQTYNQWEVILSLQRSENREKNIQILSFFAFA